MKYHIPVNSGPEVKNEPVLLLRKKLVSVKAQYDKRQYPTLPSTLVKIAGKDGRCIFLPLSKFTSVSTAELSAIR